MEQEDDHVVSPRIYVAVLTALMVLLVVTVGAACIDIDHIFHAPYWNMTIAILIAITKAVLIVLFFMHVKYGTRMTWAFASAAFVWLGIMMTLSMSDYVTRDYPKGSPKGNQVEGSPEIRRQAPRPDAVVGDAGRSAAPSQPWIARNVSFGRLPPAVAARSNNPLPPGQSDPLSSGP